MDKIQEYKYPDENSDLKINIKSTKKINRTIDTTLIFFDAAYNKIQNGILKYLRDSKLYSFSKSE